MKPKLEIVPQGPSVGLSVETKKSWLSLNKEEKKYHDCCLHNLYFRETQNKLINRPLSTCHHYSVVSVSRWRLSERPETSSWSEAVN